MKRNLLTVAVWLWLLLSVCGSVRAVVVGSTTGNTSPPPDPTFPWSNVGITNGSTGVYLGDRWVLTAWHVHREVEPSSIHFPEVGLFYAEPDSEVAIANPDASMLPLSDLALFRLKKDPGLPPLPIATETPAIGTEVYMVGHGRDRELELTYWEADIRPDRNVWFESDDPADHAGFKTINSHSLRWGTNLVEYDEALVWENNDPGHTIVRSVGRGETILLVTEFDREDISNQYVSDSQGRIDTDFEAQAVVGDSGGGVFVLKDGRWELAGIINGVLGLENQDEVGGPSSKQNALFGNLTVSANLADYRDTILSASEYQVGDFDNDGQLTDNDINLLTGVALSNVDPPSFDLNGDSRVDQADRKVWIEDLAFTYYGDSNFDGQFNSRDFVAVFQNATYEDSIKGNSTWASGDWNGDREFDSADFVVAFRQARYEKGPRPRARINGPAVVPEPLGNASFLTACFFVWLQWLGRRSETSTA